jgi:hypothetical protein
MGNDMEGSDSVLIDILFRYVPGFTEEYYVTSQSEFTAFLSKLEPSFSQIKVCSYTNILGKNKYSM